MGLFVSVNQPPEDNSWINRINNWEQKRTKTYENLQSVYQQYEECQKEHPLTDSFFCKNYLTQIQHEKLEYDYLTTQIKLWIKSNHLTFRPNREPKI